MQIQRDMCEQFSKACAAVGHPLATGMTLTADWMNKVLAAYGSPMRVWSADLTKDAIEEVCRFAVRRHADSAPE